MHLDGKLVCLLPVAEDLFFTKHYGFGAKIEKSETDFM